MTSHDLLCIGDRRQIDSQIPSQQDLEMLDDQTDLLLGECLVFKKWRQQIADSVGSHATENCSARVKGPVAKGLLAPCRMRRVVTELEPSRINLVNCGNPARLLAQCMAGR